MRRSLALIAICALLAPTLATAEDAPFFRGLNRDGKFPESNLLKQWPDGGPPLAWKATGLGDSYSAVSVVGENIYLLGMLENKTGYFIALDLDGKLQWKTLYGPETKERNSPGPRSTPSIEGESAYFMSALGVVTALDLTTKKIRWQRNTLKEFKGKRLRFDQAESLLIDGPRLIVTPGGPKASVVALNKDNGETIWTTKGLSDKSAYCAPDLIEHGGARIILTMLGEGPAGIDANTGEVLWTFSHPTQFGINATTPVYADGKIYYTSGYGAGGGMLELTEDGKHIIPRWSDKNLDNQHHGVILHEGYIYGSAHKAGRELLALSLDTGEVAWRTREVSQAVTVFADGMLYTYEGPSKGIVSLVKATPDGFVRTGQFTISEGKGHHWAHPTIANGRMYIRRNGHLFAYNIAAN